MGRSWAPIFAAFWIFAVLMGIPATLTGSFSGAAFGEAVPKDMKDGGNDTQKQKLRREHGIITHILEKQREETIREFLGRKRKAPHENDVNPESWR